MELLTKIASQLATVNLPAAKNLRDKAEALRVYHQQRRSCKTIVRQATTIRIRAERRIGEILKATVQRGNPQLSTRSTIGLTKLGITRDQSARYQKLASVPVKVFNEYLATAQQPSTGGMLKLCPAQHEGPTVGHNVVSKLDLDDDSVALILTDPPYELEHYEELAELASGKLKPGGLCLAYAPTISIASVMKIMETHLTYWWLFTIQCTGKTRLIQSRNIKQKYQAVIAYCRPPIRAKSRIEDSVAGGGQEKDLHHWQKPVSEATFFIEKLTEPGDLVVDPFCGTGTTLLAARNLGRSYLGRETGKVAKTARRRLAA